MSYNPFTETNRDLIQGLCLEAGRIMEDVGPDMALTLSHTFIDIKARVDQLHRAAEDLLALAAAMRSLSR